MNHLKKTKTTKRKTLRQMVCGLSVVFIVLYNNNVSMCLCDLT